MRTPTLVRDVMRPPVVVPEGMWFREIAQLLRAGDAAFATVVDPLGRPVGAVTEEDLLLKLALGWLDEPAAPVGAGRLAERRKAAAVTARELMSEPLISVAAGQPAAAAARLMRERGVRHLAVLDGDGWPVGMLERGDLLAPLLRPDAEIREDVEDLLARLLRTGADAVAVEVCQGVAVLRRRRALDVALEDILPDVLEVEGVVAARALEDSVADRWHCPG